MLLIIQNNMYNMNIIENHNVAILRSICDLKTYQACEYTILLIDVQIDENGIIVSHNFSLEEILISLNVVAIIANFKTKSSKKSVTITKFL